MSENVWMYDYRKMRQFAPLFILLVSAFGQTSPVPYAPGSDGPGPTFGSENINFSYPGVYSSIRKVEFRKLDKPYKKSGPDDHYSEKLNSIHYLDGSSSSKGGSALVLYSWSDAGGSSSQGRFANVFTVSGSRLRTVQRIDWDVHFSGGQPTSSFDPSTNTLVIRSSHYIPGDAHCCISAMDVVTFRWDGSHFVQSSLQTELSEYGKSEGKILPKTLPR